MAKGMLALLRPLPPGFPIINGKIQRPFALTPQQRLYLKYAAMIAAGLLLFYLISKGEAECDAVDSVVGSNGQKQTLANWCRKDQLTLEEILASNMDPLPENGFNKTKMQTMCVGEDAVNCVIPYRHMSRDIQFIYVLEKAKSVVCTIPKNLSQLLSGLVCLLHDELSFFYEKADIFSQKYLTDSCGKQHRNWMDDVVNEFHATSKKGWSYLAVIREPIDRFISAFMYACVQGVNMEGHKMCGRFCYDCGTNISCFVERHYERMMNLSHFERDNVTFLEHHIYPQSWRCGLHKYKEDFHLINYDSNSSAIIDKMAEYFGPRNVSQRALSYARELATSQRTHHSTVNSPIRSFFEQRLRSSPYLMEKLYRIYHHDFRLFGYDRSSLLGNDTATVS